MLVDAIVLILIVTAIFKGLSKGLIVAVFSFLAFIVGLAAALKLSAIAAGYIGNAVNISGRLLPVIAFFAVFIVVAILIRLVANIIEKTLQLGMLGWVNRLGGVVFYVLFYLLIFSVFLFYAEQLHVLNHDNLQASVTYPFLQPLAPKIINAIGAWVPLFKNLFTDLLHFFQNVADHSPNPYTLLQTSSSATFLI